MKSSSEYRAMARETLSNRWSEAAVLSLIAIAVATIFSLPFAFLPEYAFWLQTVGNGSNLIIAILLSLPLSYAIANAYLTWVRGEDTSIIQTTFQHFTNDYSRSVPMMLLMGLAIIGLGIITLGIGAIILGFAYSMAPYLLRDYPTLSSTEALRSSRQMMRGHKWELFLLQLSFIGWGILCLLTLGIGFLWLEAYIQTAQAHFYEDLKAETIVEKPF